MDRGRAWRVALKARFGLNILSMALVLIEWVCKGGDGKVGEDSATGVEKGCDVNNKEGEREGWVERLFGDGDGGHDRCGHTRDMSDKW